MISGNLKYKDIEFFFVLEDNYLLSLIPKGGFKEKSKDLFLKPYDIVFTHTNPVVETDYLVGICSETNDKIIMIPKSYQIGRYNSVLKIVIKSIIRLSCKNEKISKLSFYSEELNFIYSTKKIIDTFSYDKDWAINLKLKSGVKTNVESSEFEIKGKKVKCNFDIDKRINGKNIEMPITLRTRMSLEFETTNDYMFIMDLYYIAKKFIQFLTYRQNIQFEDIYTSVLNENGKFQNNGSLIVNEPLLIKEDREVIKERYIPLDFIKDSVNKIFQGIFDNTLYTRHIPLSYESSHIITEASFVLTTAGFEWEFSQLYPEGKEKSKEREEAEQIVYEELKQIDDKYKGENGRVRKICDKLNKFVDFKGLDINLEYAFQELGGVSKIFANQLYRMNDEEVIYKEMSSRLAEQRNHFAHGDLDKEFIGNSALDVIFLERFIYIMQLKRIGVDDKNIQRAINQLFKCNLIID